VPPPPADFIEATLAQAAPTPFFLNLKAKTTPSEVARWLAVPRSMRTYGAVFSGTERTVWPIAVWPDQLDGVFMVRRTTPARPLPSPPH
jgi:erythromycin esterase-like protein